jgi:glycosyltransferase involved in cell wall biosynthesis
VNLDLWQAPASRRGAGGGRLKLLFVGGDFERKGGKLLLDVYQARFREECELLVVTRDPVPELPGVHIVRAEPNSDALRNLYDEADLFVLPTQADCFGIAALEAFASCLPVIITDVGGTNEIVSEGETGWLISPDANALAAAIEHALVIRDRLPAMGAAARADAEQRFDGRRNDLHVLELVIEQGEAYRRAKGKAAAS